MSEEIMNAIKVMARLRPELVEPFSLCEIGGVKIMSNPMMPENTIMVSDDIYRDLQKLATIEDKT